MSDTPAIRLKRGEGHAFKAGGPWIYDNEIAEILGEPADGGIVRIEDYNGYPLGVGFLNRASTIAVRVLSRDAGAVIDRDFLERRVRAAWQYRKDTVDTSSCRVIFGESDFLPGLVVDKFADVLVVESLALGIDRLKSTILSLLVDLLKEDGISVRGIYERSDAKVRLKEGMERVKGFLSDPFDPVVEIVENGVRYQVDVAEGQKTGFFLDQKYNRLAIQPLARGGRVLDIFDNILMENEVGRRSSMQDVFAKGNYPLRIRLSHLKEETIKEIENVLFSTERPVQERFFKGRRVDFRKQDIELWPTECQLCGGHGLSGFRINEKAETCVPGLYAAGDVASVPQQHLSGAFVFGEIAGEQAVEFAAAHDQPAFDADAVESFLAEHERRSKMDGEIALPELEHKARRLITDYTISPKNHLKLTRWLEWSEILKDELRGNVMVRNGHDLALMYEVENIIRSADLSATAARFREESRWGSAHRRFDFPERDDVNWKCHVVLKKGADDAIVPSKVRVQNTMQEEVVL